VSLVQTGIGFERAKTVCLDIFSEKQFDLAISSGFAGALVPTCIGALVLPEIVIRGTEGTTQSSELSSFPCSVQYQEIVRRLVMDAKLQFISASLLTVPWIVSSAIEKRLLAKEFQAGALDMESAGLAQIAKEQKVPFLVIRTVSDLMNENLPKDFNLFLSASTWGKGFWRFASHPKLWAELFRLRQQAQLASRQLTKFFDTFFLYLRQQG
jgi:adenosylhomocysteine nucleosidase